MRTSLLFAVIGSAIASILFVAPVSADKIDGQEKLAMILEGYEAGEPISCIRLRPADRTRVIDGTAIVYRRGNTLYVNYTQDPESLDERGIMQSRRFTSELCKHDSIFKTDSIQGIFTGNVVLTDFIPYKRPKGS